jgi:DNA-directed RNA polymerase specialized sigma24 family protein
MRYFEGMDNKSIAKQLQISSNTVKVHLVKARQHLKQHLSCHDDIYLATLLVLDLITQ